MNWFLKISSDDVAQDAAQIQQQLNMTAQLPPGVSHGQLVRAFHVNTVIGRMFLPFATERVRRSKVESPEKLRAGYVVFKDLIAELVSKLPVVQQKSVHGSVVDVLQPLRSIFPEARSNRSATEVTREAFSVMMELFPKNNVSNGRDFSNLAELLEDEFGLTEFHDLGNEFELVRSGKTMDQQRMESEQALKDLHVDALMNNDEIVDMEGGTLIRRRPDIG